MVSSFLSIVMYCPGMKSEFVLVCTLLLEIGGMNCMFDLKKV